MQENHRDISIIKNRILQYLEIKGITKYAFYKETGATNGILSQKNGISEENLLRFLSYYPDVNPTWLLTGEGEMIKANPTISNDLVETIFNTKTPEKATKQNGSKNGSKNGSFPKLQKTLPNIEDASGKFNTKTPENVTLLNSNTNGNKNGNIPKLQKMLPNIEDASGKFNTKTPEKVYKENVDENVDLIVDIPKLQKMLPNIEDASGKFNTKTPEKVYKENVDENVDLIVDLIVDIPKLQKRSTNNIASDVPAIYDADIKTLTSLVDVEKIIPLYNMIPVDGLDDLFKQSLTPSSYISLPHLPKCDGAIYNQSKNMSPDIERGDIIVYKVVKNHNDSIIFGKTCLLSLELGGCEHVTLNEIGEAEEEGHISLISRNGQRPQSVPLESIDEIAIVAANLRYRSLI